MGQQHAHLVGVGPPNESAVVLEDQVVLGVVGGQFDLAAAGQRPALAADLGAGHVGQHGLPVGGREELHDMGRLEHVDDALPQARRHTGADEQPHRMAAGRRERRIIDDLPQHRPGVRHHRDAVLTDLLQEPVRAQTPRQGDARAADDGAAERHQQPGLVVQRGEAVDGVAAAEVGGRRGAERRQRPPVVGDLARNQLAADRAEPDEGEVTGQARVGPVPAGQVDDVGVDLLHVDDVGVVRQVQVAGFAAAEHQHPHVEPVARPRGCSGRR